MLFNKCQQSFTEKVNNLDPSNKNYLKTDCKPEAVSSNEYRIKF